MTFKSILFCLFLYVSLVWVGAYYFCTGERVQQMGLFWTGVGLLSVLLYLLIARIVTWWRLWRAKAAVKPPVRAKAAEAAADAMPEDEAALLALLAEANAVLSSTKAYANRQPAVTVASFPVYLLIGPEGTGKTSAFLDAGLEPQLLAGSATRPGASVPTRAANIWLMKERVFVELAGRSFNGELARWHKLLRILSARPEVKGWQRYWKEQPPGLDLRGVIACCDVKEFAAAANVQGRDRHETQIRHWQERLGAIADVFGVECPVHVLVMQCDGVPYFPDYFRRLPESEAGQVLGTAVTGHAAAADVQSKLLTKLFNALYYSLAEKRVERLAHEPDPTRRPAIYEFPRELKRIRGPLVQFLTAVFRPNPIRPTPLLRGFYFSGVVEREMAPNMADTRTSWRQASSNLEATNLFRSEATQIMRGGGDGGNYSKYLAAVPPAGLMTATPPPSESGPIVRRWAFVREFLETVVPVETSPQPLARPSSAVYIYRRRAAFAACGVCLLLCIAFITSWLGNWQLLHSLRNETATPRSNGVPSLAELRSLDDLREQLNRLHSYEQDSPPWRLRWGLYSGNGMLPPMQEAYFHRFQELLLNGLNNTMVAKLRGLPAAPGPNDAYTPVFRLLKTHVTITEGSCQPEPAFVASVLKETRGQLAGSQESEWQSLADRQIDFYSNQLRYGNPCRLASDKTARDRARAYLANIQGLERVYAGLLGAARKAYPHAQRLADLAPDYRKVLYGPSELDGVYSREGWSYFQKAAKGGKTESGAEACVLGQQQAAQGGKRDSESQLGLQRMFLRDYAERWRGYLNAFSINRYVGAGDAARKLETLSGHKSPLLGLLALTSNQTTFPQTTAEPEGIERVTPIVQKYFPKLARGAQTARKFSDPETAARQPMSTPAELTRAFQPVHWVVPAASGTWVTDKNGAYVDALAALGQAMEAIARAGANPDAALYQSASQSYDKALDAARQVARGFEPMGVAGLDMTVQRLLETPIRMTQPYIITDLDSAAAGKVNGQLKQLCLRAGSTLRRYPFAAADADVTLDEMAGLFAPNTGAIWKFQAQAMAELLLKENGHWQIKDPAKKPQVTPEIVNFLNRAQAITDAFYPGGNAQPQFSYTLRPRLDASFKDAVLELEVDGQVHAWNSSLQKQFLWPPAAGARDIGVRGRIRTGTLAFPFASRGGTWAIFRVMNDAEPRPLGSRLVEWRFVRGGDGRLEAIQPAPVRLEFVEFPGGADVFNPKFLQGLACPVRAVQ